MEIKCPDCNNPLDCSGDCTEVICDNCHEGWQFCPRCQEIIGSGEDFTVKHDCPQCGKARFKIPCPVCQTKILSDTDQCPGCRTKFIVTACPVCYSKVIVHPDLELCPLCQSYYHSRCSHCQTPYVFCGQGEKCTGCGRFI